MFLLIIALLLEEEWTYEQIMQQKQILAKDMEPLWNTHNGDYFLECTGHNPKVIKLNFSRLWAEVLLCQDCGKMFINVSNSTHSQMQITDVSRNGDDYFMIIPFNFNIGGIEKTIKIGKYDGYKIVFSCFYYTEYVQQTPSPSPTKTNPFSFSNTFTSSNTFTKTNTFTSSSPFTKTNTFTKINTYFQSSSFSSSDSWSTSSSSKSSSFSNSLTNICTSSSSNSSIVSSSLNFVNISFTRSDIFTATEKIIFKINAKERKKTKLINWLIPLIVGLVVIGVVVIIIVYKLDLRKKVKGEKNNDEKNNDETIISPQDSTTTKMNSFITRQNQFLDNDDPFANPDISSEEVDGITISSSSSIDASSINHLIKDKRADETSAKFKETLDEFN